MREDQEISISKFLGFVMLMVIVAIAVIWVAQGSDFFLYKVFAPKYEEARREAFEQTKSYRQGMVQELQNMQIQYIQADKEHKDALASVILHRVADFPENDMPSDLRTFIRDLKKERGLAR